MPCTSRACACSFVSSSLSINVDPDGTVHIEQAAAGEIVQMQQDITTLQDQMVEAQADIVALEASVAALNTRVPVAAQVYTPTWNNLTVGNGTYTGNWWTRVGPLVFGQFRLLFGSSTTVDSTFVDFSLPVAGIEGGLGRWQGLARYDFGGSVGTVVGGVAQVGAATGRLQYFREISTDPEAIRMNQLTTTLPAPWAAGHAIHVAFSYLAAA